MDAWHVTWTTYGAWLPGDPRGFRTWRGHEAIPPTARYAASQQEHYKAEDYAERHQHVREQCPTSVSLNSTQRRVALDVFQQEVQNISMDCLALAVASQHVHLLAVFGHQPIRQFVARLKAKVSQRLHREFEQAPRLWAKGCHMQSKNRPSEVATTIRYIADHVHEGAAVWIA